MLADSAGIPLDSVEQVLIGGSFGKYINVEKAVEIGLLTPSGRTDSGHRLYAAGDIARLLRGAAGPVVLLAHDPRRLDEAAALDVPLLLSGHTHGGQVVLPLVGSAVARKFPILSGTMRRENTTLFVSRGVGTVYVPFRWNCPPEVAVLTLKSISDFRS